LHFTIYSFFKTTNKLSRLLTLLIISHTAIYYRFVPCIR
jgi:hypothetical protein